MEQISRTCSLILCGSSLPFLYILLITFLQTKLLLSEATETLLCLLLKKRKLQIVTCMQSSINVNDFYKDSKNKDRQLHKSSVIKYGSHENKKKKKKEKREDAPNNTINRTYLSRKADNST